MIQAFAYGFGKGDVGVGFLQEYSLAFAPPAADNHLHTLKIKVKGSAYQVDHRQAYLAPVPTN